VGRKPKDVVMTDKISVSQNLQLDFVWQIHESEWALNERISVTD
jgi:hypothetical protein